MNLNEVQEMIKICQKNNLGNLTLLNKFEEERLNLICNFFISILDTYQQEIEVLGNLLNSQKIRFGDYYDPSTIHGSDIIEYFNNTYSGKDKEELTTVFAIYVFLKSIHSIVYNCEGIKPEDLYYLLDCNNYFEDMLEIISYLQEKKLLKERDDLPEFLDPNNKYKILFSGLSLNDINCLEKEQIKSLIRKLSSQFCSEELIPHSESIDHVKASYDFPILRTYLGRDYRVAYIRKDNVTVILGISLKSGKDDDYTRYDPVAVQQKSIYKEIKQFHEGTLPLDSQHYKVVQILSDFIKKEKTR